MKHAHEQSGDVFRNIFLSFRSWCILFFSLMMNSSLILECSLENDSYPKAMTREYKGKFVSKCHFCDLNVLCFQISDLGTLGPFRSRSRQPASSKATLCPAFMNDLPRSTALTELIICSHVVHTAVSFYWILITKNKTPFFLPAHTVISNFNLNKSQYSLQNDITQKPDWAYDLNP